MTSPSTFADIAPYTTHEIVAALSDVRAQSERYWGAMETPAFLAPIGDAWSPAENVRHLTKSMRAVTTGLVVPTFALWLRFGRHRGSSRSFREIREIYQARLARGASAGRFAPSARAMSDDPDGERHRIMTEHAAAVDRLTSEMKKWSEPALDRYRMPHPLLGPLTVREMLLFTLYHNQHHVAVVQRRLANLG